MDGVNNNINKIVFEKTKSNIKDKSSLTNDTESEEEGTRNLNPSLVYRDNIIKSLKNLKNKNNFNKEDFAFKPKYKIHNASIQDNINLQNELDMSNHELNHSKTNYRTMCDSGQVKKSFISSPCQQSKMNNNEFLSISRQSLNDNANESGISNTASRIAANLSTKKTENNSEKANIFQSNWSSFSKSYSMKSRRYRTIVKQDNFSAYLTRAVNEENLFMAPSVGCSNVILNLNEESNKRLDFSFISKNVTSPSSKVAKQSKTENYWACNNCDSSNPSNFNFCPTCSASNPKLVVNIENKRRPQSIIDEVYYDNSIWVCSRCATKNENIRSVCIFCFRNKNETAKRQKLDAGIQVNVTMECESQEDIETVSDVSSKWNCTECSAVNEMEREQCACSCANRNPQKPLDKQKEVPKLIFSSINSKQFCGFDFGSTQRSADIPNVPFVFGREKGTSSRQGSQEFCVEKKTGESQPSSIFESTIKFGSSNVQLETDEPKFLFGISKSGKVENTKCDKKWNCPECWVENTTDRRECACCSTKNPSVASSHCTVNTIFKFGQSKTDKEKNDKCDKKWNCSECWVENTADKAECACCSAKNPNGTTGIQQSSIFGSNIKFGSSNVQPQEISKPKFLFGSVKPGTETVNRQNSTNGIAATAENDKSGKKWNCSECWVENSADKAECACCSARNPFVVSSLSNASTLFKFGQSKSVKEEIQTEKDKCDKKWNCSECWVENSADKAECACCSAKNPSGTLVGPSGTKPTFTFGSTIKFESSNMQTQEISKSKFVFGSAKPGTETVNIQMSANGMAAENDKCGNKWNCSECWVENSADKGECACCSAKNPSVANNHSNVSTMFKFGQSKADEALKTMIKFGDVTNNEISTAGLFNNRNIDRAQSALDKSIKHTKWECPTCLLENVASDLSCVCCQTGNPLENDNNTARAVGTEGAKITEPIFQFGSSGSVAINGIGNHYDKTNAPSLPFQFGKLTNQQTLPSDLTSNLNSDCLVFTFSSPKHLEVSACSTEEPVDLVFEFASPVKF